MDGLGLKEARECRGGGRKCDEHCFKAIVIFNVGRKATVPRASGCYEPCWDLVEGAGERGGFQG